VLRCDFWAISFTETAAPQPPWESVDWSKYFQRALPVLFRVESSAEQGGLLYRVLRSIVSWSCSRVELLCLAIPPSLIGAACSIARSIRTSFRRNRVRRSHSRAGVIWIHSCGIWGHTRSFWRWGCCRESPSPLWGSDPALSCTSPPAGIATRSEYRSSHSSQIAPT
jgi:hypothetical protein